MNVSRSKDFWAGIMFLGFAAVAVLAARGYTLGTPGRMGPGYFPMALGILLGLLGLIIAARSLLSAEDRTEGLQLRPLVYLVAGVCLFGLLIERLGLVVTLVAVVGVAAFASRESRSVEVTALAAVLAVFSLGIFVYVLRLPLPVRPNFFGRRLARASTIAAGFAVALTAQNLLYCFVGVLLGTVVGVLPGIGPVTTVAMLLPISFTLAPVSALIMLAGIYYGAQYGGSTTAILVNIPGEASSVVTTIDRHPMARQGRAGPALGIAAIGSFFAGCVATLLISAAAPPLAAIALEFGPAEYFSLMVCGLVAAVVLAHGSVLKAIAMVVLGLLLGLAGT